MKIERLAISDLSFDNTNARKHSEANLKAIAGSLKKFGQRKPVVVTETGIIVAGNGTVDAATSLGWYEIDVVRIPKDWDQNQIKAFALADNRSAELAEWDHDVLAGQLLELQQLDFDVEAIGFDVAAEPENSEWEKAFDATAGEQKEVQQITFTLHKDQVESLNNALRLSKDIGEFVDTGNTNANGNALARICELWMGS